MSPASKAPGAWLGTLRRTGLFSQNLYGHLKSHLDHCCFMRNARSSITSGWTCGASGRLKDNEMDNCLNWA